MQERIKNDERISNIIDVSLKLKALIDMLLLMQQVLLLVMKKISKVVLLYNDQNTNTNATQFSMKYVEEAGLIKLIF